MTISISEKLETKMRSQAEAQGITIEAYLEHLIRADEKSWDEVSRLAKEGLDSGDAFEAATDYWQEKHEALERRLKER